MYIMSTEELRSKVKRSPSDVALRGYGPSMVSSVPCPECCQHGIGLVWFCPSCAEIEEFGSSDFGVWGVEMVMPCEHEATAEAS
jgi:hypothetical protein